jgi:hypothetical protein
MRKILLALVCALFSTPSFAAGNSVGVLLGTALVSDGIGLQFASGLEYQHSLSPRFVLGGFILREGLGSGSVTDPSQDLTIQLSSGITQIGADARYCFTSDTAGFDLGVTLGVGLYSESGSSLQDGQTVNTLSRSSTRIMFGPSLGYSLPLSADWIFTPRLNYTVATGTSTLSSFNSAVLLASVRYLF